MTNIIANAPNRFKLYGAGAALAALVIALLAVTFATASAQAEEGTNLNIGKYHDPQPCGLNVNDVPKNPDETFGEGHIALFDAYWDYNTQSLNNNLCPPLAEHNVVTDRKGTRVETIRTESNIDINTTVFNAGDEFKYTITAADKEEYPFLPPAGTEVYWLKQDDPIAEAEETGPEEPELVLGLSAGLFHKDDWYAEKCNTEGVCTASEPFQYEFVAERDHEGNVIPFLVFENDATEAIWDSRNADTKTIELYPGQYKHYNWMFFPGEGQSNTYVLSVQMKGHVRTDVPDGRTKENWKPLTWPIGVPYDPSNEIVLDSINKVVSSEVKRYTIHVGPLHVNVQPHFGYHRTVDSKASAGTHVGAPIPVYGGDRDRLHYTLEGEGSHNFKVIQASTTFVGQAVQLVVSENATLSSLGAEPDQFDLRLRVQDKRDVEDNADDVIDDVTAVRITVLSTEPWVSLKFLNENPRVGDQVRVVAEIHNGFPGIHTYRLYTIGNGGNYDLIQSFRTSGDQSTHEFTITRASAGPVVYAVDAWHGELSHTYPSPLYPIIWRR